MKTLKRTFRKHYNDGYSEDGFPLFDRSEVIELTAGGPVLGFFDDCLYEQETLCMKRGDLLIAYTHGLTE
jgi:serine phosphatase RsbU (regulator of sigma subunit)